MIPFGHYEKIDDPKEAFEAKRPFRIKEGIEVMIEEIEEDHKADLIVFLTAPYTCGYRYVGVYYLRGDGRVTIQGRTVKKAG